MENNQLLELLTKFQEASCTDEELEQLQQWYNSLRIESNKVEVDELLAKEMLAQFRLINRTKTPIIPFYRNKFFRIAVAAAAVIIILLGTSLSLLRENKHNLIAITKPIDIAAPNSVKAFITLADGKKVYFENASNGTLINEGNSDIVKLADGQISYQGKRNTVEKWNTLTVPKGSKPVHLVLADSTHMWVDVATTISYPNIFVGSNRSVKLNSGQAYFEVAHDPKKPFFVYKGETNIQVLGTHFNVNGYNDEKELKITLLEGSVKVNDKKQSVTIKPGQQAILSSNENLITNNNVDLDVVMAWKNEKFIFGDAMEINDVMRQLVRWYDIDIEIRGNIKGHIGGSISRNVNASKIFQMLEMTGAVKFKAEGKKVIVTTQN